MGLFNRLFKSQPETTLDVADDELIDVTTVSDPMFTQQLMGPSIAFTFPGDKVTITAPANGTITVLFPTATASRFSKSKEIPLNSVILFCCNL